MRDWASHWTVVPFFLWSCPKDRIRRIFDLISLPIFLSCGPVPSQLYLWTLMFSTGIRILKRAQFLFLSRLILLRSSVFAENRTLCLLCSKFIGHSYLVWNKGHVDTISPPACSNLRPHRSCLPSLNFQLDRRLSIPHVVDLSTECVFHFCRPDKDLISGVFLRSIFHTWCTRIEVNVTFAVRWYRK